uniref:Ribosomal protein S11 n=1 Tax=Ceramothamnion japonicum TaxID=218448 RepID=A0A0E3DBJ3_CERJP|nr:ribosomal protein S11 [Ceramium japonicum]
MNNSKTLILFIYFSTNNILFTITDLKGNTKWQQTTGIRKVKGTRKISLVSIKFILALVAKFLLFKKIHIKIRGIAKFKRIVLKLIFKSISTTILSFCDLTKLPHNGTKKTKFRRV